MYRSSFIKQDFLEKERKRRDQCLLTSNIGHAEKKGIQSVFERWSGLPIRFFFFVFNQQTYCGSKLISPLALEGQTPSPFCSLIKAEMLLGPVIRVQTSTEGVEIFYQDISGNERQQLFSQLMADQLVDIYFPFVHLDAQEHKEITSSPDGWPVDDESADFLSLGEIHQRKVSIDLLMADKLDAPVVYDPSCSTGEFLSFIKQAIPDAIVIGQDLSQDMCCRAAPLLDHVIHGDSICPGVRDASCDYIFFRFLNAEVVSTTACKQLFDAIIPCLKLTGKAIIFGFTPVLIALPYLIQQGFHILSCHAPIVTEQAIIQYYIIQRLK